MIQGAGAPPGAPNLSLAEADAVVETKTAPRVPEDAIKARIKDVQYIQHGTLTVCVIEMHNGWKQVGSNAPASEANFDPEVGKRYAYEDAFNALWRLEGYLLRDQLHAENVRRGEDCPVCGVEHD